MLSRTTEIIYSDTNSSLLPFLFFFSTTTQSSCPSTILLGLSLIAISSEVRSSDGAVSAKGSKLNLFGTEHCPLVLIKLTNSMGNSCPKWIQPAPATNHFRLLLCGYVSRTIINPLRGCCCSSSSSSSTSLL